MNKKITLLTFIVCLFAQVVGAQVHRYSESFLGGGAATAQCNVWNTWRATLTPGIYTSFKISGSRDPIGYTCTDVTVVNAMANAIKNASAYISPLVNGHIWHVCNRFNGEVWIDPPSSCSGANCPSPGYIVRPCIGGTNPNWGGIAGPTCGAVTQIMTLEFFYGLPCTSTPVANIIAPDKVCPNKVFTLKPDNFYADADYTWEYSDNNGMSWITSTATVDPYTGAITDAINTERWYKLTIKCKLNSFTYTTPVWRVSIAPFYYCYCDNGAASTTGLDIGNVKLINLTSNDTVLNNGNSAPALNNTNASKTYSNFQYPPNKDVIMYRDTTYNVLVSQINSNNTFTAGNVAVFIDYDRNGLFDFGEKVMDANINTASVIPNTASVSFKVPSTAAIGYTGMRVILSNGNIDSCGFGMAQGEVEDYLVDMRYEPCKGPGNAGTLSSTQLNLCRGYDYITRNTGYETFKSELQKVWQLSGDNIIWNTIPGTTAKDTLMRVFNGQPLYYRVRMVCPRSNDTTYTTTLKIGARDSYKCYCFSQAIGGSAKDSSDIGGITFHTFNTNTGGAHLLNQTAREKRTDYTDNTPVMLDVDSVYKLTVYHTQHNAIHGDSKVTVFMDFNNNNEYDTPYERVYTGFTNVGNFTVIDNIKIPTNVITGVPTGMRVILNNDIGPNIPSDEGCGAYTSGETEDLMVQFTKRFPASIYNADGINNLGVYPNPAKDRCRIQFNGANNAREVVVTIVSITGQKIFEQSYAHNGGSFTQELNTAKYTRGVYYVEVLADGQKAVQKLILE